MAEPLHRIGIRYTPLVARDVAFLQQQYNDDNDFARRGELFLNEALSEIYFVDSSGVAKKVGQDAVVPFTNIDFSGVEEFVDDAAAQVGGVEVGGIYHTSGVLKIRLT